MKPLLVFLFAVSAFAQGHSVTLAWKAPADATADCEPQFHNAIE